MRETLGPLLASLGQVRRRSILFLFVAALVVWGLITWIAYTNYRSHRSAIQAVERGDLSGESIYRLMGSYSCDEQQQHCQLIDNRGQPYGPTFAVEPFDKFAPGERDPFIEGVEKVLPQLLPYFKADLARLGARLAPRALLRDRTEALGTFFGILFVVLIASTLIGAEWRWGVWRTLLTHEPRRGRVLAAKLGAVWVAVAVGAVVLLAVTASLDAFFRQISDISASGGPRTLTLARVTGRSLLSLELYATVAAAFAVVFRTSFAGMGSLLFILVDGLASRRFTWLRHILPTQQIATILPGSIFSDRPGYAWWPLLETGAQRCETQTFGQGHEAFICFPVRMKPIPHWRASVVLVGWLVAFALAAWAVLRARDVPQ